MFVIEGGKIISDLLMSGELNRENLIILGASKEWIKKRSEANHEFVSFVVEEKISEIKKLTTLQTAPEVLAVVKSPEMQFRIEILNNDFTLVFDAIRDPGNLGTIIRTADWYGIKNLICSSDSVDNYNSKVVQASMGGVIRVNVHYVDLTELFRQASVLKIPIYGTALDGEDFFDTSIQKPGIIVFGNESKGIHQEYEKFFFKKIKIPDYPIGKSVTESLNIASSVAIVCSEIRRRERSNIN
jgi:TrmH family RNA methyltransferase